MKVLAILYDGGKAAQEEPRLLGTTENKVRATKCTIKFYTYFLFHSLGLRIGSRSEDMS